VDQKYKNLQNDGHSPFARLQDEDIVNHSIELKKVPNYLAGDLSYNESEGGESEMNWAIPTDKIREVVHEFLNEFEKSTRALVDSKLEQKMNMMKKDNGIKLLELSSKFDDISENIKQF